MGWPGHWGGRVKGAGLAALAWWLSSPRTGLWSALAAGSAVAAELLLWKRIPSDMLLLAMSAPGILFSAAVAAGLAALAKLGGGGGRQSDLALVKAALEESRAKRLALAEREALDSVGKRGASGRRSAKRL